MDKNLNLEIFTYTNINKGYVKIMKLSMIVFTLLKYVLLDFNYDTNIKSNLKRIIQSINENLLSLTENLILPFLNNQNSIINTLVLENMANPIEKFREFIEHYEKISKYHKVKMNKKDFFNFFLKNCETPIHSIRQFSK